MKITPAMRAWCRRLVNPDACTLTRSRKTWQASVSGTLSSGTPTWRMVDNLEDAGLIRFEPNNEGREVARLTDAGKANAK